MVRYYGCLSSHASLRREVVPEPPPAVANPLAADSHQLALQFESSEGFGVVGAQNSVGRKRPWAWLLRHVWEVDVSTCLRCGGAMKWIEVATEPAAIARVLARLRTADGSESHPKPRQRERPPPPEQLRFGFG
jgi:hypothetical protein